MRPNPTMKGPSRHTGNPPLIRKMEKKLELLLNTSHNCQKCQIHWRHLNLRTNISVLLVLWQGAESTCNPSRPGGKKPTPQLTIPTQINTREERLQVPTHKYKCVHKPDGMIPVLSLKHFSWLVCNTKA